MWALLPLSFSRPFRLFVRRGPSKEWHPRPIRTLAASSTTVQALHGSSGDMRVITGGNGEVEEKHR